MATTDKNFNPPGKEQVDLIKESASDLSDIIKNSCPDNHVRQIALDNLRIATAMAVQSLFESGD